jgi:Holliday junction resolvase RusA-like endonuclease|tara:strand:- start:2105 stop:2500 length:396 start_codon:yes stop_codon:yes gene_type:complete
MITKFNTPFAVYLPRVKSKDKRIAINLNTYRNLHFLVNNQAKTVYKKMMAEQLEGLIIEVPVEITYQVFKPSKRSLDKMNVVSIASKFFLDAVTEFGCWDDDNDDNVKTEIILPTELDKDNPRVEITIKTI